MSITEVAYTCYPATDLKRARKFYEEVLGLKPSSVFEKDTMGFIEYWIGPEGVHTFAIGAGAPNFKPGLLGGTIAFEVDDFDGMIKQLKDAKAVFMMEPHETGVCFMALVKDTEGNQIMIHRRKVK